MKYLYHFLPIFLVFTSCQSQSPKNIERHVGGACQGCEAVFEYGNRHLTDVDTLPGFEKNEPKLKIEGTIYHKDGRTPAEGVILYIYHTNRQGIYDREEGASGWASRHGRHRGWIKTGKNGTYTFYTFRPAAYPNLGEPEHIHMTVKEADKNEYYIDDIVFDDDAHLTPQKRNKLKGRGGLGIVRPVSEKGHFIIQRDIILGENIPDYY